MTRDYGYELAAAVFVGGLEKVSDQEALSYGLPLYREESPEQALAKAIDELAPDAVVDLSDEPVLDYVKRFRLASLTLARGVAYVGADFRFDPPDLPEVLAKASIGVIGTGKRIGKTAISGFACRELSSAGFKPVAIAMGRGGPPEPEILLGREVELTPEGLLAFADSGKHAASDYFEDALTSRITTIGCRRCGGGLAGAPFVSNVLAGARLANSLEENFVVAEGSGATLPPLKVDAYILSVGAGQPLEYVAGYFGTYRALLSDVVAITMCEEPFAGREKIESIYGALKEIKPDLKVVKTVFRPKPLGEIKDKRVFVAMTASPGVEAAVRSHLEAAGAQVVGMTYSLSNRPQLKRELKEASGAEVLLTELKAAAVDVATREALAMEMEVIYLDNEPVTVGGDGDLKELILEVAGTAVERFSSS
ncbi:MAG: 2,3-diphosphoglycerate synthetase [Actinobacteria bacterium]|nr:2,3-diphosphoglycerate synthetase [Actinomycetota bacterium]